MNEITMSSHKTIVINADGYNSDIGVDGIKTLVAKVTGDDTKTWRLQGTIDHIVWSDIADSGSNTVRAVNATQIDFNVLLYSAVRVVPSDTTATYTLHMKGILL